MAVLHTRIHTLMSIFLLALSTVHSTPTLPRSTGIPVSREVWQALREKTKEVPCENVLTGMSGTLTSPNYPDDYPNDVACSWDIEVPAGNRIKLHFDDFFVQPSSGCTGDYVGVYDGQNHALYCGWQPPPDTMSVGNVMGVILVSDDQVHAGSRFSAEYEADGGGDNYNCSTIENIQVSSAQDYGFIYSPGYPSNYPNNLNSRCGWSIRVSGASKDVVAGFLQFRTQSPNDVVNIYSSDCPTLSFTGNNDFPDDGAPIARLLKTSDYLTVTMDTDAQTADVGYLLAYSDDLKPIPDAISTTEPTTTEPTTTEPTTTEPTTTDFTASSWDYWWYTTISCYWSWSGCTSTSESEYTSPRTTMKPTPDPGWCRTTDWWQLSITEDRNEPLGKSKGDKREPRVDAKSQIVPHKVHVDLRINGGGVTAEAAPRGRRDLRADAVVDAVPGRKFGFIKSPNYPDLYPNGELIIFNVTTSEDSRVALRFLNMDVEPCCDYVEISEIGYPPMELTTLPTEIIYSQGSEIFVKFFTDSSERRRGFLLAYASIDP